VGPQGAQDEIEIKQSSHEECVIYAQYMRQVIGDRVLETVLSFIA
jgi:hypothetical protein